MRCLSCAVILQLWFFFFFLVRGEVLIDTTVQPSVSYQATTMMFLNNVHFTQAKVSW